MTGKIEPPFGAGDLLAELQELMGRARQEDAEGGWLTARELREHLECPNARLWGMLQQLDVVGRLEVSQVRRRNVAGVLQRVPGYRLKVVLESVDRTDDKGGEADVGDSG